ncbi:DUF167 domain-containing protein [Candidatus Saccharibacteria bacterium]|nr:DUF167 domain-containing protein [Candidatus Saccharibacteria bacterium]
MKYEVKVTPGAKKEEITVEGDKITIRTPKRAHDGEANEAIVKILAKHFHTGKSNIKIIRGQTSKIKIIEIG